MNTDKYHKLCNSPCVFARSELEQTLVALEKSGSVKKQLVYEALQATTIEKPTLHQGGSETDYFEVIVEIENAEEIIEELGTLEAQAVSPEGNSTALASHYAALQDRWFNYVEAL